MTRLHPNALWHRLLCLLVVLALAVATLPAGGWHAGLHDAGATVVASHCDGDADEAAAPPSVCSWGHCVGHCAAVPPMTAPVVHAQAPSPPAPGSIAGRLGDRSPPETPPPIA